MGPAVAPQEAPAITCKHRCIPLNLEGMKFPSKTPQQIRVAAWAND